MIRDGEIGLGCLRVIGAAERYHCRKIGNHRSVYIVYLSVGKRKPAARDDKAVLFFAAYIKPHDIQRNAFIIR